MKQSAQVDPCLDLSEEETGQRFSTVELCGDGSFPGFRFRVWTKTPSYLSFLPEDGLEFASHYKPGDTLIVKFHHEAMQNPGECMKASIRRIKQESHGKLSGQYLVALDVINTGS